MIFISNHLSEYTRLWFVYSPMAGEGPRCQAWISRDSLPRCFDQWNYFPFEHWDFNPSRAQSCRGKKQVLWASHWVQKSAAVSLLSGVRDSGNGRNHVTSPSSAITPPHTVCSTILCDQPTPREINRWGDKQIWISVHCSFEWNELSAQRGCVWISRWGGWHPGNPEIGLLTGMG